MGPVEPSSWSRAVLRGVVDALGGLAERSEVVEASVLAAWLEGDDAYVVYRKTGQRGIFGYCFNTYEPYAGTLWPEPEEVAYEHALLGVHEPHEEAPEQDVELGRITWWGPVRADVPVRPDAVPPPEAWTCVGR